ncbi:MAG: AbrB/MazE/SpoVT family DNA-binding domain-containing protein [Desulfurococcales archaeon]|nr:AbrB/MazE/SpoVT family DNA-binding domain-containing protein [Desulfurococcales archaeon]
MSLAISKRRIQKLGGSSLIITIPKSWARKIGLTVGDTVIIVDEGDHLKIMPPDTRVTDKVGIARVKLSGFLREVSIGKIIDCSYQNGHSKIEIQIPSNGNTSPEELAREAGEHPKVKAAQVLDPSTLLIELETTNGDEVTTLLKKFNTKLQEIIDLGEAAITGSIPLDDAIKGIERSADNAYNIVDSITRLSFKQGIVMCESKGVDPTILIALKILARLLERAMKNLVNFSERELSLKAVGKIRIIMSEAIGGIASGSGRRIANALNEIAGLREIVAEMRSLSTPEAEKVATCVESMNIAVETLASKGICSVLASP